MSCELLTEQGLTAGIAALQIFVGAFRSTKQHKAMNGRRERERERDHRTGAKLADRKHGLCLYHAAFLRGVTGALGGCR